MMRGDDRGHRQRRGRLVMDDLAERAVACKGWRWLPRMLLDSGGRVSRADSWGVWYWHGEQEWCIQVDRPSPLPDLTDPATFGCLLALAREAWGDPRIYVRYFGPEGWHCCDWSGSMLKDGRYMRGDSEAAALVSALEAAP
jgi:hypothetical protein